MRLTYLDDAGLFNKQQEPFIVAAGALIDGDNQIVPVETHLDELVKEYIPEADRTDFVFHATELWSGSRYFKDDGRWPLWLRRKILTDLVGIPQKFDLPVVFGFQDRQFVPNYHFPAEMSTKEQELIVYADVVARFCEVVEKFMRLCAPDEITILIAEDRDSIRNRLKAAHAIYRNPNRMKEINPTLVYFPFTHIRDTIHFAGKRESKHLQIADTCTFVIKKRLEQNPHIDSLYQILKPHMIVWPPGEGEPEPFC